MPLLWALPLDYPASVAIGSSANLRLITGQPPGRNSAGIRFDRVKGRSVHSIWLIPEKIEKLSGAPRQMRRRLFANLKNSLK